MSDTTQAVRRPTVALELPKSVPPLIVYAQGIVKRMTANPAFANPTPALAVITSAVDDLQTAEASALARTKGAAAIRNAKRTALIVLLQQLRAYIQTTADANPPTLAASVIQSSGVAVRKTATRQARTFAAKQGKVSGTAAVTAKTAAKRASYEWQYSTDGGKTWISAPATLQSKTSIAGLTPGATVQIRYRAVTKSGEGDWSQSQSLIVH
ncbi:MAG: fibronectin type III domain-containing protein [Polyangiaceae bacterium]